MEKTYSLWKEYNIAAELLSLRLGRGKNLVGEYAEYLIKEYLNGELLKASSKSADIKSPGGQLYQVKSRVLDGKITATTLGIIRSWDFDYLAVVLFNPEGSIYQAILSPVETAKEFGKPNEHQNGYTVSTSKAFLDHTKNIDVTEQIRQINGEHEEIDGLPIEKEGFVVETHNTNASNKEVSISKDSVIEDPVQKVSRKLPGWFKEPKNISTRILLAFFELEAERAQVKLDALEVRCKSKDIKTFKSNFDQMRNFGEKNHGKIFSLENGLVKLWDKTEKITRDEYRKYLSN